MVITFLSERGCTTDPLKRVAAEVVPMFLYALRSPLGNGLELDRASIFEARAFLGSLMQAWAFAGLLEKLAQDRYKPFFSVVKKGAQPITTVGSE